MKNKFILLVLLCFSINANAQLIDSVKKDLLTAPDTVKHLHSKFLSLVPPAAMISYGAISFAMPALRRLDYSINNEITKTSPGFTSYKTENYTQFAPAILVYGLNLVGISGKNTFLDRTILLGLSTGIMSTFTATLKHTTHRLRPNSYDYLSFPSGHTSTAFATAEFMAQEYSEKSPWYGVAAYALATTTGVFRLYNHDHWFSDVVAGAGFGIISTKLAYLAYPYLRNAITHTDKNGKSSMLVPNYQDGVAGFTFAMQL